MSEVEQLEKKVQALSPQKLSLFRAWFVEFDAQAWDRQIAADQKSGKLKAMLEEARAEYKAGKSSFAAFQTDR